MLAPILSLSLVAATLIVPAVLSRRRHLSVGRWLAAAALCFFAGGLLWAGAHSPFDPTLIPRTGTMRESVTLLDLLALALFFGIGGCILAAIVHPKGGAGPLR